MRNQMNPYTGRYFGGSLFDFASAFDRLFDDSPERDGNRKLHSAAVLTPACDLSENESQFLVSLDMPGVAKDDIKIEVQDGQLIVTAERKSERSDAKGSRHVTERSYGRFHRAFSLGNAVNLDGIQANYKDGVLELTLPKAEAAKPRQIRVGGDGGTKTLDH